MVPSNQTSGTATSKTPVTVPSSPARADAGRPATNPPANKAEDTTRFTAASKSSPRARLPVTVVDTVPLAVPVLVMETSKGSNIRPTKASSRRQRHGGCGAQNDTCPTGAHHRWLASWFSSSAMILQ